MGCSKMSCARRCLVYCLVHHSPVCFVPRHQGLILSLPHGVEDSEEGTPMLLLLILHVGIDAMYSNMRETEKGMDETSIQNASHSAR